MRSFLVWLLLGSAALAQPSPIPGPNVAAGTNAVRGTVSCDGTSTNCSAGAVGLLNSVNQQVISSYTILSTDNNKTIENIYTAGAIAFTLPNVSATGFGAGFATRVCNLQGASTNNLTITVNSPSLIWNSSSVVLGPNTCMAIADLDGTTYMAFPMTATTSQPGVVEPDGTIITVSAAGAITVAKGSSSAFGVVEVDNTTISASSGVISAKATPLTAGSSTGNTFTAPRGYFVCTSTCTVTPPVPAAGYEFCVMNGDNVSTVITLGAIGTSARYENTARTAYGTAGTGTFVSGGAVGDKVCLLGLDSTHYLTPSFLGTWTAN